MHVDKIDKYFADRGVKVIYNCLGHTEELVRSYIKDFQQLVDVSFRKQSQDVKYQCYNTLFNLEARPKFTGFENFETLDKNFRIKISKNNNFSLFSPSLILPPEKNIEVDITYKESLIRFVQRLENPLLYFSGGLDSELIAKAMLHVGKKFTPVIFQFQDKHGRVLNAHDFTYAYDFCDKNNLSPIIKTLNIENLWQSQEFYDFAVELEMRSPQIATHAYMVKVISDEFKDYTHVFGGEVRFKSNFKQEDQLANLAYLTKIVPSDFGSFTSQTNFSTAVPSVGLRLWNDGTWDITSSGTSPASGSGTWWQATPGNPTIGTYNLYSEFVSSGSLTSPYTIFPTTNYSAGIGGSTTACSISAGSPFNTGFAINVVFNVTISGAAQPGISQTGSITMSAYDYTT